MMHGRLLSYASDWERRQGYETVRGKFQARMRALGTTGENCVEVNGRLTWIILISSDYSRDRAWLEGRSVQFLEGSHSGSRVPWK